LLRPYRDCDIEEKSVDKGTDSFCYSVSVLRASLSITDVLPPLAVKGASCLLVHEDRLIFEVGGERYIRSDDVRLLMGIGGHVERGESFIETLARESLEEIGVSLSPIHSENAFLVNDFGEIRPLQLKERPSPLIIYGMLDRRKSKQHQTVYYIVSYICKLGESPVIASSEEITALISVPRSAVREFFCSRTKLKTVLDHGGKVVAGQLSKETILLPVGTAKALFHLLSLQDIVIGGLAE